MEISKRLHLHALPVVAVVGALLIFASLAMYNSIDGGTLGRGLTTKFTTKDKSINSQGISMEKLGDNLDSYKTQALKKP